MTSVSYASSTPTESTRSSTLDSTLDATLDSPSPRNSFRGSELASHRTCQTSAPIMAVTGPLRGIKVIEFGGLAPAPMCGMFLSDFGANVIRVDKPKASRAFVGPEVDRLARGKQSIEINLKTEDGIQVAKRLCLRADVLLEPFRTGVMEKLGLCPKTLMAENPRLIYARLTGYGQTGPMSRMAGHDINYLAISGVLSMIGRKDENPLPPLNLLGDFGGGGLICALGILMALFERNQSGKGQVIDANIVEGTSYLSSWLWRTQSLGFWNDCRGKNLLDSGRFYYDTYKTKDNKYMAVGALEPQFYAQFMGGMGLDIPQHEEDNEESKNTVAQVFCQKTQAEWTLIFKDSDACVTPILSLEEALCHPHNIARGTFVKGPHGPEPRPSPLLDRTPAHASTAEPVSGQHTVDVLLAAGYTKEEVEALHSKRVVGVQNFDSAL